MMFACPCDFEPGMWFRAYKDGPPLQWVGVESIVSRFPGRSRVRVLVKRGRSFVTDVDARFQVIDWRSRDGG